ncbi:MAG: LemA family protein [Bacillota bacterium]
MFILISLGGIIGIVVGALVLLIILAYLMKTYNMLVHLRNRVRNSWSQIDVQLKRRFDMIPNLVETIKGYAKHESEIFKEFAEARKMYQSAPKNDVEKAAMAERGLNGALSRLMVVQEQYPELKANENFKQMMAELRDTEDKIAYSRQFYNDTVMKINNKIEMFPSNIVASLFKFKQEPFFEVDGPEERKNVKVQF